MKKLGYIFITLFLVANIIGLIHPNEVQAKNPPVFNMVEIRKDILFEPVTKADLIALGTITNSRYEIIDSGLRSDNVTPGKIAYTLFTLSVEKVIKGDSSAKEVIIRISGGYIGNIYQFPTERYFRLSDHMCGLMTVSSG